MSVARDASDERPPNRKEKRFELFKKPTINSVERPRRVKMEKTKPKERRHFDESEKYGRDTAYEARSVRRDERSPRPQRNFETIKESTNDAMYSPKREGADRSATRPGRGFSGGYDDPQLLSGKRLESPQVARYQGKRAPFVHAMPRYEDEPRSFPVNRPSRFDDESRVPSTLQSFEESTAARPYKDKFPIPVPRSMAASEFLYGTSVVQAALTAGRRELFKLFLYSGEGRISRDSNTKDKEMAQLATDAGVPIQRIRDAEGLRLMDKMSGGRPHNVREYNSLTSYT
jgi:RNA 2'-O ribose methyltransferase substrate binding